jgi:hypothetical protein
MMIGDASRPFPMSAPKRWAGCRIVPPKFRTLWTMTTLFVASTARKAVLASLVSRAILASFGFAWAHAAVKTAVFLFPASFSARATKKSCQVLRTMVSSVVAYFKISIYYCRRVWVVRRAMRCEWPTMTIAGISPLVSWRCRRGRSCTQIWRLAEF